MDKTLGIDLGTNSIGLTLKEGNIFTWYGVYTFKKGVGDGKSGEFSLAAERTQHRSTRRLYNARRYRKWETLKILIEHDFCPLPLEKLNRWKYYTKGFGRVFPVDDKDFANWVKLNFLEEGKPDYSSPYQLRKELINEQLDLSKRTDRHKIGRALYHIAQRRGFKSSRKIGANEKTAVYKGSKETGTIGRNEYENLIDKYETLGAAFAHLENENIRVRNRYTLRSDYRKEVEKIIEVQNLNHSFGEKVLKAIFFQRPLRSQKHLVGKCSMEPNKPRCPISHPSFEEYRAWSFVNNIKYQESDSHAFKALPLDLKEEIINNKLLLKTNKTNFKQIRKFICSGERKNWKLNYSTKMDDVSIPTQSVSAYLNAAFGREWKNIQLDAKKKNKMGEPYSTKYDLEDIWHILFSFEDEEYLEEFLFTTLGLEEDQVKQLKAIWNNFPGGYASLSLKAINNILPFLKNGMLYSESVFLAKIPEIIGKELFEDHKEGIIEAIVQEFKKNHHQKTIINITNALIADYKILDWENKFAHKDYTYELDAKDKKDVLKACERHFGSNRWTRKATEERDEIFIRVEKYYQAFFTDPRRDYFKQPKLQHRIQSFLLENFEVSQKELDKLYHPSMVDIYPSREDQELLASPKTRAFKNPMVYKTLHKLKKVINHLIESGLIDNDTRIVVEIARELNDKNRRAAIKDYQNKREKENQEYADMISELIKDPEFQGMANPYSEKDIQKFRIWTEQISDNEDLYNKISATKDEVKKYRLWKEQNSQCLYTGRIIKITDLFNTNLIDFEHTIPRSKSFDNSLANLTVCYADYNRNIKKNKIPTDLPNYDREVDGFTPIEPRLDAWKSKVESLHSRIQTQVRNSKFAIDKETKDTAIRRRHQLQMEYDYWRNKLDRFTRKDIPPGFKNSQLVDTQIISKYAYHYLKTVFGQIEVIKGSVTADFRKIYGIQTKSKKDRSKHYHHAIDAAVLTLLPRSNARKELLKKAYEFEETYHKQYHEKPFENFDYSMLDSLKEKLLINNLTDQDRTLTPSKKVVRQRKRIQYVKDAQGNKVKKIATGQSIRGQLHLDTFYGKIKVANRDEDLKPKRTADGDYEYSEKPFKFVLRIPIEDLSNTNKIVDPHLANLIESQLKDRSLKQAIADGIYMIDKNGNKTNRIRRIRVWQSVDPLKIKNQTYISSKPYKNYYYAKNADNFAFAYYVSPEGMKKVQALNLFQLSQFDYSARTNIEEFFEEEIVEKKQSLILKHVFQPGQKVIFYNHEVEIQDFRNDPQEISNRLYIVKRLYQASRGNIQFQHHLEARSNEQLTKDFPSEEICPHDNKKYGKRGMNGFSVYTDNPIRPRLLLSSGNFNFLIEGKDFEFMLDGTIKFLRDD